MKFFSALWPRIFGGGPSFEDAVNASIDRANVRFVLPEDSRLYVTSFTRHQLNEKSEWLWQNFALVKELVEGIARHTIAKGIAIQLETEDHDWNLAAERDFENWALTPSRCDIAGRRNFYDAQTAAIEQWSIRGEFFSAFVANPQWPSPLKKNDAPSFWLIDSNDVRSPQTVDNAAQLESIVDGIELGKYGEPQKYYVRTAGEYEFAPIPVGEMCHWFKPHAINQPRGITPFAQAVNSLVDVHELTRMTTRSAKAQQLIAIVLKEIGKTNTRGAAGAIVGSTKEDGGRKEIEAAGRSVGANIVYTNKDGDVKMVSSSQPSPLVEPFIRDLLLRNACLAPGVPMEFFWDPSKLGGANTRFVLGRADLFFQILADGLVYRFCNPCAIRVLSWRMENGLLPPCKDPLWMEKIGWQLPARLTVDIGNTDKSDNTKLRDLRMNLRSYYSARGQNWLPEVRQRVREMKMLKQMCEDDGVPELYNYFTALDPGSALVLPPGEAPDPNKPPADPKDPEDDKAKEKKAA